MRSARVHEAAVLDAERPHLATEIAEAIHALQVVDCSAVKNVSADDGKPQIAPILVHGHRDSVKETNVLGDAR